MLVAAPSRQQPGLCAGSTEDPVLSAQPHGFHGCAHNVFDLAHNVFDI